MSNLLHHSIIQIVIASCFCHRNRQGLDKHMQSFHMGSLALASNAVSSSFFSSSRKANPQIYATAPLLQTLIAY